MSEEVEEDYGALIYRESQLRKAEAAAKDAKKKKKTSTTSTASTRRSATTSARAASTAVTSKDVVNAAKGKCRSKKKRAFATEDEEVARKRARWRRYTCSTDGCTNKAVKGGVCIRHGAKVEHKRCSSN